MNKTTDKWTDGWQIACSAAAGSGKLEEGEHIIIHASVKAAQSKADVWICTLHKYLHAYIFVYV